MNGLSVSDGFKFGCGFFLAAFIVWIVMAVITVLLSIIMRAAIPELFRGMRGFGMLLPLLIIV